MRMIKGSTSFDFLSRKRRNVAIGVSVVLILISLVSIATRSLDFGIDFTGGVLLEVGYPQPANPEAIRQALTAAGFDDMQVTRFGDPTDVQIRLPPQGDADPTEIRRSLQNTLSANNPNVDLRRVEFVGPQVGHELTEKGSLSMVFAMLMIFGYVMLRFQWKFAVGAVIALAHDVIITIGFFSVFHLPFDLSVVAAVLAVIGYSLNDTVVTFDRIRENFVRLRGTESEEAMNISVNEVLARTIITGLTTLIVLAALLLLGGESVSGFSIALIVGIVVGTYSSTYIASATALVLDVNAQDLLPPKDDPRLVDDLP